MDLIIETLLCPNGCTYDDCEAVWLVNGQRCPVCRWLALLDDGWEESPVERGQTDGSRRLFRSGGEG